MDFLNDNSRIMELISLSENVLVCIAKLKYLSASLKFAHFQRTWQVAVGK